MGPSTVVSALPALRHWLAQIRQMADVRAHAWGHDVRVEINLIPAAITQQSASSNRRVIDTFGSPITEQCDGLKRSLLGKFARSRK
jgi:hypothetical protein